MGIWNSIGGLDTKEITGAPSRPLSGTLAVAKGALFELGKNCIPWTILPWHWRINRWRPVSQNIGWILLKRNSLLRAYHRFVGARCNLRTSCETPIPGPTRITLIKSSYKSEKATSFDPAHIAAQKEKACQFLEKLTKEMDTNGPWIWGQHGPCILDTHVIPFLIRIQESGCEIPLTARLHRYTQMAKESPAWQQLMQGLSTLPPASS